MENTEATLEVAESLALLESIEQGLSKRMLNDFKLVSVTFELAGSDVSDSLKIEVTYANARLFLRWLEDRGCVW